MHAMPMLSPVLEDFVPLKFRGNVPDDVAPSPTPVTAAGAGNLTRFANATGSASAMATASSSATASSTETASAIASSTASASAAASSTASATASVSAAKAPPNNIKENPPKAPEESDSKGSSADDVGVGTGIRSRVAVMLLHWRKGVERGPVQVPVQKSVQVQGLRRQKSKKSSKPRRSVGHYLNPKCLFGKIRDAYIHLMNGVATSGIVASGPTGDSSAQQSTLFFSREFDSEARAQLMELERSGSKADADYRQNMAFARNIYSSRVKPFGDAPLLINKSGPMNLGGEPVLTRSKSTRSHADVALFSTTRSGRRLSGPEPVLPKSRSISNSFSDEVFFSSKLKGSRKKKLHINPYADSDWKADAVLGPRVESKVGPKDIHFQRQNTSASSESRTEFRLQQSSSRGSLFVHKY